MSTHHIPGTAKTRPLQRQAVPHADRKATGYGTQTEVLRSRLAKSTTTSVQLNDLQRRVAWESGTDRFTCQLKCECVTVDYLDVYPGVVCILRLHGGGATDLFAAAVRLVAPPFAGGAPVASAVGAGANVFREERRGRGSRRSAALATSTVVLAPGCTGQSAVPRDLEQLLPDSHLRLVFGRW